MFVLFGYPLRGVNIGNLPLLVGYTSSSDLRNKCGKAHCSSTSDTALSTQKTYSLTNVPHFITHCLGVFTFLVPFSGSKCDQALVRLLHYLELYNAKFHYLARVSGVVVTYS